MMSRFEKLVTFGSLVLLLMLAAFVSGFAHRHFHVWPTYGLIALDHQLQSYLRYGEWGRSGLFVTSDVSADDPRAEILRLTEFLPGYRAIMAFDPDLDIYSVRLLDAEAQHVHTWPTDYKTLRPDHAVPAGINPHGMEILRDGSIVVNFGDEGQLMTRLDPCGTPLWQRTEGRYHHSVHLGDDNMLWTWFSPNDKDRQFESIVAVDAYTGNVLRKISIEEVAAASIENAVKLAIPDGFVFQAAGNMPRGVISDIFHPNDVEPLTADLAPAFPQFEQGDLLISLRDLNYVAVLDPDTVVLKWGAHGPWIRQHDPDFTPEGRIDVYNNNTGRGRSGILSIDPASGAVTRLFDTDGSRFYTGPQGKQQRLPNGNYLITVPEEGRVIELNREGALVFDYNNIADEGVNGRIFNAFWVPPDFFAQAPSCAAR